jgi:HTH-type transcriptional regulator, competence development regulator
MHIHIQYLNMKPSDAESQAELKKLGDRIRQLRKHRNLRLLDLEVLSDVTAGDISRFEHGSKDIRFQTLYKLATALGVAIKEITDYDGPLPSNAGFKGLAKQKGKKPKG